MITNAFAAGKITGAQNAGVVVGVSSKSTWTSVYGDSTIWNFSENAGGELKNTPQMVYRETFDNWDFDSIWTIKNGRSYPYLKKFGNSTYVFEDTVTILEGSGTNDDPYLIESYGDLNSIGYSLYTMDKTYRLANDIVVPEEAIFKDKAFLGYRYCIWFSGCANIYGSEMHPQTTVFSGKFQGAGHSITGFYASSQSDSNFGFIDTLAASGLVDSLTLVDFAIAYSSTNSGLVSINYGTIQNVSVNGKAIQGENAGGIASENYGVIQDCHVSGNVIADSISGGVAAQNWGSIENCVVDSINTHSKTVGGAVGINYGSVANSSVGGTVSGRSGIYSGGFVGVNKGVIANSSAVDSVKSGSGFVGMNDSLIENCHASGYVYSGSGFVQENNGTITRSYTSSDIYASTELAGGFAGTNSENGSIKDVFASGEITFVPLSLPSDSIWDLVFRYGNLVGEQLGTVKNAYSVGYAKAYGKDSLICSNRSWTNPGENVYYNSDKCSMPDSITGMIALTDSEMVHHKNFAGFDFKDVWTIDEGVSYPVLRLAGDTTSVAEDTTEVEEPKKDTTEWTIAGARSNASSRLQVSSSGSLVHLQFGIANAGIVELALFDMQGQLIAARNLGTMAAGVYHKEMDAVALNKGRYIVVLRVNGVIADRSLFQNRI